MPGFGVQFSKPQGWWTEVCPCPALLAGVGVGVLVSRLPQGIVGEHEGPQHCKEVLQDNNDAPRATLLPRGLLRARPGLGTACT